MLSARSRPEPVYSSQVSPNVGSARVGALPRGIVARSDAPSSSWAKRLARSGLTSPARPMTTLLLGAFVVSGNPGFVVGLERVDGALGQVESDPGDAFGGVMFHGGIIAWLKQ